MKMWYNGYRSPQRYGQKGQLLKVWTEPSDQTIERAIAYLCKFGTDFYCSKLLDKMLLDMGIDVTEISS